MYRDQWWFQHALEWQALWLHVWMDLPNKKRYCLLLCSKVMRRYFQLIFTLTLGNKKFQNLFIRTVPCEMWNIIEYKDFNVFEVFKNAEPLVPCWAFSLFFLYDFKKGNVILDKFGMLLWIFMFTVFFSFRKFLLSSSNPIVDIFFWLEFQVIRK